MFKPMTFTLEDLIELPCEKVWELLSNTDHLNETIGLFPVVFGNSDKGSRIYRNAKAKVANLLHMQWEEYPFEWEENRKYTVERKYVMGPIKRFFGGIEIYPINDHSTTLRIFAIFTPANILGKLLIPYIATSNIKKTRKFCLDYLKLNRNKNDEERLPFKRNLIPLSNDTRLLHLFFTKLIEEYPVNKEIAFLLKQYMEIAPDQKLINMKPHQLAGKWEQDRRETVRVFLYATKVGLLTMNWNVMCPNCRISKGSHDSLAELNKNFHCDLCGILYEANFDQYVELRFTVHPAIKKVNQREIYCVGGPFLSPHVIVQKIVNTRKKENLTIPEVEEDIRVRVLGLNDQYMLLKEVIEKGLSLSYTGNGFEWNTEVMETNQLTIENNTNEPHVFVIEKISWDEDALTAAEVSTMKEFRKHFSSEVLAPGQELSIGYSAFLFSDLKGSTSFYEAVGDAHAYSTVRNHFTYMEKWIDKENGTIVKTIGDAVMAVFIKEEDAIRAAYQIQLNLDDFNSSLPDKEKIIVKIGVHAGSAIVVNTENKIDYFGSTVNIASRLLNASNGDDIILTEGINLNTVFRFPNLTIKYDNVTFKGMKDALPIIRLSGFRTN